MQPGTGERVEKILERFIIPSIAASKMEEAMYQSLSQLWIHLVFSTKDRRPIFIDKTVRTRLFEYLAKGCHAQGCYPKIIGGHVDHVHLLFLLPRNMSLSTLVRELKATSSKWIKKIDPENKNFNQFAWQSGYSAFSVSHSAVAKVYLYILKQEEHHQKKNYRDELLKFLKINEINFDEKYLWD